MQMNPYPCPCPDGCNGCDMVYDEQHGWRKEVCEAGRTRENCDCRSSSVKWGQRLAGYDCPMMKTKCICPPGTFCMSCP